MNKHLTHRSRISIILALLVLSFAFIFCGISSYSFKADASTNSVTAKVVNATTENGFSDIWGNLSKSNTAPNGLTGTSYSPASINGWTINFSSSVNISSLDKSKLVMKIWVSRANVNQRFCQMNLNGDNHRISSAASWDSESNPINELTGNLTGWMQLQFPITSISFNDLTSLWIFVGNNGSANATTDMLLYEYVEFAEVDNPDYAVLSPVSISSITLQQNTIVLNKTTPSFQLNVTTAPTNGLGTVVYSSSAPSVIKVDSTGKITALSNGTATITASIKENPAITASCTVTASGFANVTSVSINDEKEREITSKDPIQLTYSVKDGTTEIPAESYTTIWSSSDKKVATVSDNGKVDFFRNGTATITLTVGNKSDSVTFIVTGLETRVNLVPTSWFWELNESESKPNNFNGKVYSLQGQPSGQGFTPNVKEESLSGFSSNKTAAFMWIYLSSADAISSTTKGIYAVSYHNGTEQVYLDNTKVNQLEFVAGWNLVRIPLGDTTNKTINKFWILMNGDLGGIKMSMPWIDEVTEGECTCAILETQTLYKSLQAANTSITINAPQSLGVSGKNGQFGTIMFKSSNENIVAVDEDGNLQPLRDGNATVTAYLQEDDSVKITVNVTVSGMPQVTSIAVTNGTELALVVDDEHMIEVSVLEDGAWYQLEYSSDNADAVLVNSRGKIIAVGEGSATITVKISGTNISATISVTSSKTAPNPDTTPDTNPNTPPDDNGGNENSGANNTNEKTGCAGQANGNYQAVICALALASVVCFIKKRKGE